MHQTKIPCCDHHYGRGSRDIRIYRGPIYQAGSVFFGDVFRKLVPLFTSKVLPYVGKKLLQTGDEVMGDVKQGTSFGTAFKRGAKRAFAEGKEDVLRKLRGEGYKKAKKSKKLRKPRKKTRATSKPRKKTRATRKKTRSLHKDFFSR
jgi:hypothetical protein